MIDKTPTPRTDAHYAVNRSIHNNGWQALEETANFARQLERELAAAKIVHDSYAEIAERDLTAAREAVAAKDAEIERRTGERDRWQQKAVKAGEIANDLQNKWLSDKARAEAAESRLREVETERDALRTDLERVIRDAVDGKNAALAEIASLRAELREMAGKAKGEVSRILRETLSGLNTRYSHPSGAGRWGLVEADIHAVIDALARRHATTAADAPEVKS